MMIPNAVQFALRTGSTPEDLTTRLGIKVKSHPKYPNLLMFKYNQIASPMADVTVCGARGVILDSANNYAIVSWPFDRFFNVEQSDAADIDWSTAKVQEKADGSLMCLYHYDGAWQVSSSGLPDAGGQVQDSPFTFRELFWKTFNEAGYGLPTQHDHTFMFEMTSPYTRIVVPHKTTGLTLIGVRNNITGQELNPSQFMAANAHLGFPAVKEFDFHTLEATLEALKHFEGVDQEGFVVVDAEFNRVKIKHPGYLALHHMKGEGTVNYKKMLALVLSGEGPEVLSYFPEWQAIYDTTKTRYDAWQVEMVVDFDRCLNKAKAMFPLGIVVKPQALQKEFASEAIKTKHPEVLFSKYHNKIKDFKEFLNNPHMPLFKKIKVLGLEDKDELGD